jgi:hypothetical protein
VSRRWGGRTLCVANHANVLWRHAGLSEGPCDQWHDVALVVEGGLFGEEALPWGVRALMRPLGGDQGA